MIVNGKVNKVIIEHKDRLTRFQFDFIKKIYAVFGCEIIVLDGKEDVSVAEELTRGLMALLASFMVEKVYKDVNVKNNIKLNLI